MSAERQLMLALEALTSMRQRMETAALNHSLRIAEAQGEIERLRDTLEFVARHFGSDWPEHCQASVKAARAALRGSEDNKDFT